MASTSTSSSSNLIPQWNFDVFLSFRGDDTRFTFTDHLYENLKRRGIHTFRDDSIKTGEEIAPELLKVIEESRFALIVFSENYAASRWCLDELVKIMECKKEMKQTVIPIFYHVDPSHVRNQTEMFGEAFISNHKEDTEEMKEKVRSWRTALTEAADISGQHVKDWYESEHIKKIVNDILMRLHCRMIDVGPNLVGMDSHVNEIIRRLCVDELNDVRIIGICGIGGIEIGIQVLYDKSLISLSENKILMHDLIQEMGWHIIRNEFPNNPEEWSRLWDPSDVCRAFGTKKGMKKVEAIFLDLSTSKQLQLSSKVFSKMKQLRLLKIYERDYCGSTKNEYNVLLPEDFQFPSHELRYLYWEGCPLKSLPSNFHGENLVELNMMDSNIKQLWQGDKSLGKLKMLNLQGSKQLTRISNFSNMPNLEMLELASCTSLDIIDPSIGVLKKLSLLNLSGCENLTSLPSSIQYLDSLETIYLNDCSNLEKFPEMKEGSMKALSYLHFDGSAIKELPSSIEYLIGLEELYMRHCKHLRSLPSSICRLKSLRTLHVFACSNLGTFPEIMEDMELLEYLNLGGTTIKELPSSIHHLHNIGELNLNDCKNLRSLPSWICRLKSIVQLSLMGCSSLQSLPENIGDMVYLERLYLGGTGIKELPASTQNLKGLKTLSLDKCTNLVTLPNSIYDLSSLQYLRLIDCSKLEKFPKNLQGLCSLVHLNLSGCNLMEGSMPTDIGCLYALEILDLSRNRMVTIPSGITQLRKLHFLFICHCKMLREIPGLPSSLEYMDAHDSTKLEMLSSPSILWSFLLKWFKSTSHEHFIYKKRKTIIIPGNVTGIPSRVLHQGIGSLVRIEPPSNWFDDNHFMGFAFFCLYCRDQLDLADSLSVSFYTKNAIRENSHGNQPPYFLDPLHHDGFNHPLIKGWGVQLIYTYDYVENNVHKLLDHQRIDDDARKNQADE